MAAVVVVLLVSLAATLAAQRSSFESRRERELDLLFVGLQIRDAISSYAQAGGSAAGMMAYPKSLEDLLEDNRTPVMVRHLRRLYADPMTGQADWVLEKIQDRIVGVHSRSTATPIRHAGFPADLETAFAEARSYRDWRFVSGNVAGLATPSGTAGANAAGDTAANAPAAGNSTSSGDGSPAQAPASASAIAQCQAIYGKSQRASCFGPGMSFAASQQCSLDMQNNLNNCVQAASAQGE